ncbi:MAG TPA: C40 family peptidase [Rhizomicrobium sp.]|nr:C40 family peptidase [Rhizomicrobium sp.]
MSKFDRRTTPARADLAAAHLSGRVDAPRYTEGKVHHVIHGRAALRAQPSEDASLETELLFGEGFSAYDIADGWAWGQSTQDQYVGYVRADALAENALVADHRVTALMTPMFPAADLKRPVRDFLPMNAKVKIEAREGKYARIGADAFVFVGHLTPLNVYAKDWVAVAERFVGAPYVWGGKTAAGMDCSGLIQTALEAGGVTVPRDTDMQERALAQTIEQASLQRGDFVFWKGHMGVMLDEARLLHANAFHMEVSIETLSEAIARITDVAGPITSVKRL